MCVYMGTHVCVSPYMCVCICVRERAHVCVCELMHVAGVCLCVRVYGKPCTCVSSWVCMCMYIGHCRHWASSSVFIKFGGTGSLNLKLAVLVRRAGSLSPPMLGDRCTHTCQVLGIGAQDLTGELQVLHPLSLLPTKAFFFYFLFFKVFFLRGIPMVKLVSFSKALKPCRKSLKTCFWNMFSNIYIKSKFYIILFFSGSRVKYHVKARP